MLQLTAAEPKKKTATSTFTANVVVTLLSSTNVIIDGLPPLARVATEGDATSSHMKALRFPASSSRCLQTAAN